MNSVYLLTRFMSMNTEFEAFTKILRMYSSVASVERISTLLLKKLTDFFRTENGALERRYRQLLAKLMTARRQPNHRHSKRRISTDTHAIRSMSEGNFEFVLTKFREEKEIIATYIEESRNLLLQLTYSIQQYAVNHKDIIESPTSVEMEGFSQFESITVSDYIDACDMNFCELKEVYDYCSTLHHTPQCIMNHGFELIEDIYDRTFIKITKARRSLDSVYSLWIH